VNSQPESFESRVLQLVVKVQPLCEEEAAEYLTSLPFLVKVALLLQLLVSELCSCEGRKRRTLLFDGYSMGWFCSYP